MDDVDIRPSGVHDIGVLFFFSPFFFQPCSGVSLDGAGVSSVLLGSFARQVLLPYLVPSPFARTPWYLYLFSLSCLACPKKPVATRWKMARLPCHACLLLHVPFYFDVIFYSYYY